jgi:hypothetical protein
LSVSLKQILLKLSVVAVLAVVVVVAVVVVLLKMTMFPEASPSLHEQFKSAGAVSIYSTPPSSQFNVHYIPQRKITTSLHPHQFTTLDAIHA